MSTRKVILIAVFVLGLISGPSMLMSARAAVPPINWDVIPFVIIGSVVGVLFVIGIQLLRKNPKPAKFIIRAFEVIAIAILGSGITSFGMSVIKYGVAPSGVFVAAWGIGLSIGLVLVSVLFHWRYRNVL